MSVSPVSCTSLCMAFRGGVSEGREEYDVGQVILLSGGRDRKVSFFCLLLTTHTSPTQIENLEIETEGNADGRVPFLLSLD